MQSWFQDRLQEECSHFSFLISYECWWGPFLWSVFSASWDLDSEDSNLNHDCLFCMWCAVTQILIGCCWVGFLNSEMQLVLSLSLWMIMLVVDSQGSRSVASSFSNGTWSCYLQIGLDCLWLLVCVTLPAFVLGNKCVWLMVGFSLPLLI